MKSIHENFAEIRNFNYAPSGIITNTNINISGYKLNTDKLNIEIYKEVSCSVRYKLINKTAKEVAIIERMFVIPLYLLLKLEYLLADLNNIKVLEDI